MQSGTSTLNGQVPASGLSVTEAAQVLGISPNTVRARIKAGKLRAERAQRPQGEVIRVFLDLVDLAAETNIGTSRHVQSEVPVGTYTTVSQVPALANQAEALARLVHEAIAPIERERDHLLLRNEALARENGQFAERVQELERHVELANSERQELEVLRAEHDLHARHWDTPAAESAPRRSWWAFWR